MKKMATAALSAFFAFMASAETNAPQEMIASYLRLNIANQVAGQAAEIVAPLKEKARAKLLAKVEDYRQGVLATIRERLVAACGDAETAEESFGRFVSTWTTAESENDGEFLAQMSEIAGIDPPESTYNGLKGRILEKFLPDDLAAAGQFLSGLQAQVADKLAKAATASSARCSLIAAKAATRQKPKSLQRNLQVLLVALRRTRQLMSMKKL